MTSCARCLRMATTTTTWVRDANIVVVVARPSSSSRGETVQPRAASSSSSSSSSRTKRDDAGYALRGVDEDDDDPWSALGVAPGASAEACKRAYKRMAKLYHPDVNPNAEEQEMFLRAKAAYETLSSASGSDLQKVQTYEWKLKWKEQLRKMRDAKAEKEREEEAERVTMVGTETMKRQIASQMAGLRDRGQRRRVRNVMKPTPVKFDEPFAHVDDDYSWNHEVQ